MKINEIKAAKGECSKWKCHKAQTNCTLKRKGLRSSMRLVGKKQDEKNGTNQRIEHPMEFSSKSTKSLDSEIRVKNKKTKNTEISYDEESNSLDHINKEIEKIINFVDSDSIVVESMGHYQLNNEAETSVSHKKILPITAKSHKENTNLNLKSNLVMCKGDGVGLTLQAKLENDQKIGEGNSKVKLNSNELNYKIVAKNTRVSNSSRKGKHIPCKGDLSKKSNRLKQTNVSLLDLPNEILTKILNSLSYLEVGKIRRVCKRFDAVGCDILNNAFQRLQQRLLHRFQQIKAKMPRRESARRRHPLARESDIIETLHMRLTLLQMSFGKHIEKKHCCFFAGEILDEILNILSYVKTVPSLGRAYKVTDELFDLTTMAMEYFKEHIEPTLPEINYFSSDFIDINTPSTSFTTRLVQTSSELPGPSSSRSQGTSDSLQQDQRVNKLKQKLKTCMSDVTALKKELKIYKGKLADQQKQFVDLGSKLEQHDKKFEESACQFGLLLHEYQSCKKELQNWRQSCSCHPTAPSPTRPTVSVEEQESPNKPSSNNVIHSPASQDITQSSPSQENLDNDQNSEQFPIANSDSLLHQSKDELLTAVSCKRKQNRNYKISNKRMKISANSQSNNNTSQL